MERRQRRIGLRDRVCGVGPRAREAHHLSCRLSIAYGSGRRTERDWRLAEDAELSGSAAQLLGDGEAFAGVPAPCGRWRRWIHRGAGNARSCTLPHPHFVDRTERGSWIHQPCSGALHRSSSAGFCGSQGSRALNDAMISAIPRFARQAERFRMIHQTGERDFERVRQAYECQPMVAEVYAFIEDVPHALEQADLVISRAGASTVAELTAAGKPALLIPFPHATDQHQLANARAVERAGGAKVLEQCELTPERLYEEVTTAMNDPEKLIEMGRRARRLAHPQAAAQIADLIEELAQGAKHRG